ncbi:ATP-dependent DNA helicase RecG [anaerobic digester metagenome]
MQLDDDIKSLKGVGEKTAQLLHRAGIESLMDLILYFPRDYERISEMDPHAFDTEEKFLVRAQYLSSSRPVRTRTGKTMTTLTFDSAYGPVKATYFNMPYAAKSFTAGQTVNLYGKFKRVGSGLSITNPKVMKEEETGGPEGGKIIARYPLKEDLTDNLLRKLVNQVLANIRIAENLPAEVLAAYAYPALDEAIRTIHNPESERFDKALERLKFQELFAYSMKIQAARELRAKDHSGIVFSMSPRLREFKEALPYELTQAQSRSIREILLDQKKDLPMNRLLQGDVGSGKTIVALTGLFNVVENGYQGALMVPTEILAAQHYADFLTMLEPFGIEVRYLVGSLKAREKQKVKEAIASGRPMVVIGTHAILEEDVAFPNLGLVVTDEQHRFGVNQRLKFIGKNRHVDVLVMSATPIPRTLALHLYSDLDLSVIDELPPGREPVLTRSFTGPGQEKAYALALKEIEKGRQVYVVCPLIEDNDNPNLTSVGKLTQELSAGPFRDYTVAMIHGRMKPKEKEAVMDSFKTGNIDVLVSTTVIEVGVNVPNASVMIVQNAERFGLSQLHQLRGRVGRGSYQSYCLLLAASNADNTRQRLEIMTSTNDGFKIAEADLKMRGTGAIFGTNQSGDSGLTLASFIQDYHLFLEASKWAARIFRSEEPAHRRIKEEILSRLDENIHLICLN